MKHRLSLLWDSMTHFLNVFKQNPRLQHARVQRVGIPSFVQFAFTHFHSNGFFFSFGKLSISATMQSICSVWPPMGFISVMTFAETLQDVCDFPQVEFLIKAKWGQSCWISSNQALHAFYKELPAEPPVISAHLEVDHPLLDAPGPIHNHATLHFKWRTSQATTNCRLPAVSVNMWSPASSSLLGKGADFDWLRCFLLSVM